MKYSKIFILLLLLQSFSSFNIRNDWSFFKLKGKVLSFLEFHYSNVNQFDSSAKDKINWSKKYFRKYNEKGNITEVILYDSDSKTTDLRRFEYNDKGEKFRGTSITDSKLETKDIYKYDNKGNIIECKSYNIGGTLESYFTYKYDNKGNVTILNYNSDGTLKNKDIFIYDNKWDIVEDNMYDSEENLQYKNIYKYDNTGNLVKKNSYDSEGNLLEKYTFKYEFDNKGNWVKRIVFLDNAQELISTREYEYYK